MERKEILEKVTNLISEVAEVDKKIIKEESLLNNDLEVESLDLIDLVVEFEKEFNVSINDKEIKIVEENGEEYCDIQFKDSLGILDNKQIDDTIFILKNKRDGD